ncbi:MAG: PepSY domain-containing protein [Pseudomonadota bacterium]
MRITDEFRKSMNWLHTWTGIALSSILFAMFWMGTLTVFHLEINKWMMPETRIAVDTTMPMDPVVMPQLEAGTFEEGEQVFFARPSERMPLIRYARFGGSERQSHFLHPETGEIVERTNSHGASDFFYPFHFSLHISWMGLGYWIVGLASVAMLVLAVSGIFIHRKIFQDFFSFRPKKQARRSTLDLHNMTAIIALPFHILFPLSGILIFALVYFPDSASVPFGGDRAALNETRSGFTTYEAAGEPGPMPQSIDQYIDRAEAIWTERDGRTAHADYLRVANVGDANSVVTIQQSFGPKKVARGTDMISFRPGTGEVVKDFEIGKIRHASAYLEGAHFLRFDSWAVRWLFFLGGLAGCAMIATGLLFWMRARIKKGMEPTSVRVVRALSAGSVTGIIAASGAFMVANRLLTNESTLGGLDRAALEVAAFYVVWLGTFIHAGIRDKAAWREQMWLIAVIAGAAPILNWITTGGFIVGALQPGQVAVAMTDVVLIAASAAAVMGARRMAKTEALERAKPVRAPRAAAAGLAPAE